MGQSRTDEKAAFEESLHQHPPCDVSITDQSSGGGHTLVREGTVSHTQTKKRAPFEKVLHEHPETRFGNHAKTRPSAARSSSALRWSGQGDLRLGLRVGAMGPRLMSLLVKNGKIDNRSRNQNTFPVSTLDTFRAFPSEGRRKACSWDQQHALRPKRYPSSCPREEIHPPFNSL